MTAYDLICAGIPLAGEDDYTELMAKAALEWIVENTSIKLDVNNQQSIESLPANAKLFVCKYVELFNQKSGVSSQSIEGLSISFDTTDKAAQVSQLANSLLWNYMKSQVTFTPAKKRW